MEKDETDIMPVNFSKVSVNLHEFIMGLGRAMGWNDTHEEQIISYRAMTQISSMKNDFKNYDICH